MKFTFRADPRQKTFWGTLSFEVNFTATDNPCQKCLWGLFGDLVKFTFTSHPRQKTFWGTLGFEVNFTATDNPRQKYLRGRSGSFGPHQRALVKFTFRALEDVRCGDVRWGYN